MTKKDFKKMADILRAIKPMQFVEADEIYYGNCRLFNDFLSRFNVAFILGNKNIQQSEFINMIERDL